MRETVWGQAERVCAQTGMRVVRGWRPTAPASCPAIGSCRGLGCRLLRRLLLQLHRILRRWMGQHGHAMLRVGGESGTQAATHRAAGLQHTLARDIERLAPAPRRWPPPASCPAPPPARWRPARPPGPQSGAGRCAGYRAASLQRARVEARGGVGWVGEWVGWGVGCEWEGGGVGWGRG